MSGKLTSEYNLAPVLIPTLCRDRHLISLLESLSRCRLSEQTEVYIALDYPLTHSHEAGYKRICNYLDKVGDMSFKKLHVIKRNHNYGFGKTGNANCLIDHVLKEHDQYIFTEDDNVFAPGFLEFMNYNLQLYKSDKSVFAVSGYMYPLDLSEFHPKILKLEHFSAWGYGTWKDRREYVLEVQNSPSLKNIIINDEKTWSYCHKKRPILLTHLLGMERGMPILGDSLYSIIQIYNNWFTVFPSKSLVRNCGWDGSGTHGGVVKKYLKQPIDTSVQIDEYIIATEEDNLRINDKIYSFQNKQAPIIQKALTFIGAAA